MPIIYEQAIDEMFALFKAKWDAESAAVAGYVPEIRWDGVPEAGTPDKSKFWARVSTQEIRENQDTLSDCVGEPGKKRYLASGLIFVQIFSPLSIASSKHKGRILARIARNAFRGKTTAGGIWFRNARINNLAADDNWNRFNAVAEYEFNEIG